jgi:DNA-binding CsgD family transcriptional regulator
MDGLCALIEADSWAWATTCRFDPDQVPLSSGFLSGGFSAEQFAKFQEALEHPDTGVLNAHLTREFDRRKSHLTRLRDQIDVEKRFRETAVYSTWIAAGIEEVILSIRPCRAGNISQVGIYRRPGRKIFTLRESRISHIVLAEVPWLHEAVLPSELGFTVASLAPRQRIILNLLLDGQSRIPIAGHLGLSAHTVHGYVKEIFSRFGVHSQTALIARFRNGDGGDLP